MGIIQNWISKYTGVLRSLKIVYIFNNFLHRKKLVHNKALFKKYGIRKNVLAPIGKQDFKESKSDIPWLDQAHARERMLKHPKYSEFSPEIQQALLHFLDKGMITLPAFYSADAIEHHWQEIERLKKDGKIGLNYTGRKYMQAHRHSPLIQEHFFKNKELLEILEFIMGRKILPFHTIHFEKGSEQKAHSDFIHMTTEPQGYLIAAWTALERVDDQNGSLFYYPGSHKLPYITCQDYDSGNSRWLIGEHSYSRYEDKIAEIIQDHALEKVVFHGNPGDVFIWHGNLLHGGSPIIDSSRTRKSMVAHYFCEDVICYHEISQRPALIDPKDLIN